MTVRVPQTSPKTIADWLAQPEEARLELIDGAFVEKAAPSLDHARAQSSFGQFIRGPFDRKPGGPNGPGGWWIGTVPHYWILDPIERTLTVHRHGEGGYVIALRAEASERVRAEPFEAVELHAGLLLGDDPE
jgi:Uma2 family endonuclease